MIDFVRLCCAVSAAGCVRECVSVIHTKLRDLDGGESFGRSSVCNSAHVCVCACCQKSCTGIAECVCILWVLHLTSSSSSHACSVSSSAYILCEIVCNWCTDFNVANIFIIVRQQSVHILSRKKHHQPSRHTSQVSGIYCTTVADSNCTREALVALNITSEHASCVSVCRLPG